ncbi:hypothetical protein LguiB_021322 [Lonicera macranthoides]
MKSGLRKSCALKLEIVPSRICCRRSEKEEGLMNMVNLMKGVLKLNTNGKKVMASERDVICNSIELQTLLMVAHIYRWIYKLKKLNLLTLLLTAANLICQRKPSMERFGPAKYKLEGI